MQVLVAAAVVVSPQGFWLVRRAPGRSHAGMWEFPGGKVEPGETPQQALQREMWEELQVQVRVGPQLARAQKAGIDLLAFEVSLESGPPVLHEHDAQVVVPWESLAALPMTELDQEVARQLRP